MDQPTSKLVEAARELLRCAGYCVDNLWHVDDVHFICQQQELPQVSDEEAAEVFAIANEQFEGEVGLSWPKLEKALRTYLQRRIALARLCEGEGQA